MTNLILCKICYKTSRFVETSIRSNCFSIAPCYHFRADWAISRSFAVLVATFTFLLILVIGLETQKWRFL
jgi:hypothetical protein